MIAEQMNVRISSRAVLDMPVIKDDNIDILQEKIDAWGSVQREVLSAYCEVLKHLTFLVNEVDGHPAASVKMLIEIKGTLSGILDILRRHNAPVQVDVFYPRPRNFWYIILALAGTSAVSAVVSLLTLLALGIIHI